MSKHTTTIMEILQSELQRNGFNEFVNNNHISLNDNEFAFIQKILRYDDDVNKIVNNVIFKGFKFNDERIDRYFKESFVTRFLDREIGRQTVEAFASQVLYVTLTHEDYIYTVYGSEMIKYLEQQSEGKSIDIGKALENAIEQGQTKQRQQDKTHEEYTDNVHNTHSDETHETHSDEKDNDTQSTNDNRSAKATLPQSEVNINVDNTELNYADENDISKTKDKGSSHEDTSGKSDQNTNGQYDTETTGTKDGTFDGLTNGESDTKRNTQSENEMKRDNLNKQYLIDNLEKIYDMRDRIFDTYDKKCFLHIW